MSASPSEGRWPAGSRPASGRHSSGIEPIFIGPSYRRGSKPPPSGESVEVVAIHIDYSGLALVTEEGETIELAHESAARLVAQLMSCNAAPDMFGAGTLIPGVYPSWQLPGGRVIFAKGHRA